MNYLKSSFNTIYFPIILLTLCVLLVSYPGWNGGFIFDDYPHILNNISLKNIELSISKFWTATLSGTAGPLGRPVSMLSFAIDSYLYGMTPYFFKLTNTIIHTLNTILVFFFCNKLLKLPKFNKLLAPSSPVIIFLSFLISLIWAISPININSSLYIVQRMNELSFFFVLIGCLVYLHVRTSKHLNTVKQLLFFILLSLILSLAILSKENGLLLVPLLMLLEFFLLYKNKEKNNQIFFYCTFIVFLVLPVFIVIFYLINTKISLLSYAGRDFTVFERSLSQLRVVIYYIKQLLIPDIYQLSYLNDDFPKSTSLFQPISTLTSLIFWLSSLFFSMYYHKKYPWLIFSLLWFWIGHSIESTIIALEMFFEHRNYLPSFGIIFLLIIGGYFYFKKIKSNTVKWGLSFLLFTYVITIFYYSHLSAKIVGSPLLLFKVYAQNHPNSARSQLSWGEINYQLYIKNPSIKLYSNNAEHQFKKVAKINPNRIAALTNLIILKRLNQKNYKQPLEQLYKLLANVKNHAQNVKDTRNFIKKNSLLPQPLKIAIFDKYFTIIFDNPYISAKHKGLLHKEYADYISLHNGATDKVVQHYKLFAKLYPTVHAKLLLVSMLIDAKYYKEASEQLNQVEKINEKNRYIMGIKKLKKILSDKN
jgi:protein O-mannosyl-transferase